MKKIFYITVFISAIISVMSCRKDDGDINCTADYRPGFILSPVNEFGLPVCDSIIAVILDGDYSDTLHNCAGHSQNGVIIFDDMCGAYERPGNYTLMITSDYFKSYVESDILVTDNICHVTTVRMEVSLERK